MVVTKKAAYFTDSQRPVLYRIALSKNGAPGALTTIPLTTIESGSYDLANGDGLLLQGRTLYVVQNRSNNVAVFRLSTDLSNATFTRAITDADFDVPTTIDRAGGRLYVVNARFGTTTPTDQSYHVVKAG